MVTGCTLPKSRHARSHQTKLIAMKPFVNQPLDPLLALMIRKLSEGTATESDLKSSFCFGLKLCGQEVILRFRFLGIGSTCCEVEALSLNGERLLIDGTLSILAQTKFSPSDCMRCVCLTGTTNGKKFYADDIYGGISVLFKLRELNASSYSGQQVIGRWILFPPLDIDKTFDGK